MHAIRLFIPLFLCAVTLPVSLTGQVSSQDMTMSQGTEPALVLRLPTTDEDDVEDLWEDWLKDTYDVKTRSTRNVRTGELSSLNFTIPGINEGKKLDMYSIVREAGEGSQLYVWIATPKGYVGPDLDPTDYVAAEKMLTDFADVVSRDAMQEDVDTEEDLLSDLEDDLEDLQRDKRKAEDDIEDARERIAKLEAEIAENVVAQEEKQRQIQEQIETLERAKLRLRKN
ncbi:hypothetical protein CLV84_1175 [Neolewinella xylanilytica]|uniref:Uncharacterized protein n=1 Tax=Neolewinella xylanilytica TaxID=1514080 RepID=A0A2S6I9N6_9BACT|nr:hypothetical protein [Neolewinella xylanilytica]PPK88210.1 hypothetical protein CLV84_1175 [Neolewinella xylanilytica]